MTEIIDKSYFHELNNASPETLCRKGRCCYNSDTHQYNLEIWGGQYDIDPANQTISQAPGDSPPLHEYFDIFAMYYLLRVQDFPVQGQWVSEKDLPGGTTFFRGPHLIPTDLISNTFGNDLQNFKNRCIALGGTPIDMADAAYSFHITADIPVAVLFWTGDEDFPAEAKILYDQSIAEQLSLDIVWALAVGVCARISSFA